eukprot:TRINITY_DN1869_c0_g2_i1.p1 TRINITY_DN1869_c0_g2~~TRINITY_DN1869_c0_g2_i1.p1  ORF type:complete len:545 (-),score=188.00 TRINITY_DN1869_c0_g2_i1:358-1992(-)
MAQKTKATTSLVEEQAPAKVLKVNHSAVSDVDPQNQVVLPTVQTNEVPEIPIPDEGKLRIEVQSLLVGIDLTTTVGQLRNTLETRFGLAAGSLSSSKKVRRRVDAVIQQEAQKKARRTPECDQIVKELIELPDYPSESKQMLLESLPHATVSGALHPHQVRMLSIIRDALGDGRQNAEKACASSKALMQEQEEELSVQESSLSSLKEAEAVANSKREAAAESLQEAEQEVSQLQAELEKAQDGVRTTWEETVLIREEKAKVEAITDGPLKTLVDGTWEEDEKYWEAFEALQQYLMDTNAESSLLTAVTVAFQHKPSERSLFDNMAAEGAQKLLKEQLDAVAEKLAARTQVEFKAEAARLGAESILRATSTFAEEQAKSSEAAHAAHQAAVEIRKKAEESIPTIRAAVAEHQAEQARFDTKLQQLDAALVLLDRWISESRCSSTVPDEPMKDEVTPTSESAAPAAPAAESLPCIAQEEVAEVAEVAEKTEAVAEEIKEPQQADSAEVAEAAEEALPMPGSPTNKAAALSITSPLRVATPLRQSGL